MAVLRHVASGQRHELAYSHLVGRSLGCLLRLPGRWASAQHAVVQWNGATWQLRDLGSTNGTYVDQTRLAPGKAVALARGTRIGFGDASDTFVLDDDAPPRAQARSDRGDIAVAQLDNGSRLYLPNPETPELVIVETHPGQWQALSLAGIRSPVVDGTEVRCAGRIWQLILPPPPENTLDTELTGPALADIGLRIRVSPYREHIEIVVLTPEQTIALPPRRHDRILYVLAEARLEDRAIPGGIPESEEGWREVGELTQEHFNGEPNRFHVALYRARQQLDKAGIRGTSNVFERRPVARQIRLSIGWLELETL